MLRRLATRVSDDPRSLNPGQRLLGVVRGSVNPLLLRTRARADYDLRQTLLVSGFPRSGTTWLAEILAALPDTGVLFEPLDIRRVQAARESGLDWDNFRLPDEEQPQVEAFIREMLEGRTLTPWTTSHLPISQALRLDRWVVKLVRGNQMLGWIVANFDLLPPVLLVRHPCAVYDSWLRRGWSIASSPPSPDLGFFQAYPEFRSVVARLTQPEEFFAAEWAMEHVVPLDQLDEESFQLCFYERLRADGPGELARIFERWGLTMPPDVMQRLERPSAKSSGLVRSMDGRGGWRARVDPQVQERMIRVLRDFGLDLYTE